MASGLAAKIVDICTLIVLARLLSPADFGLVAMAMTLVVVIETIFNIPIGSGILRAKVVSKASCDTAFTLAFLRGTLVGVLLLGLSFPVSRYFGDARLLSLCWVIAVAPVVRGLVNPRVFLLQRRLDFRFSAYFKLIGKLLSAAIAISVAVFTKSYWAIAIVTLVTPCVLFIGSYLFVSYRPRFSLLKLSDFSDIVGWSTLNQLFSALNWQSDRFVLGGVVPADMFGRYSMSANLANLPAQIFVAPLGQIINASFGKIKDRDNLKRAYLKSSQLVCFLVTPLLLLGACYSRPILLGLFPEGWDEAIKIFSCLCLIGLVALPTRTFPAAAMHLRVLRVVTVSSLVEFVCRIVLLAILVRSAGIDGAIYAGFSATCIRLGMTMYFTKKIFFLSFKSQTAIHIRTVVSGIVLVCTSFYFLDSIDYSNTGSIFLSTFPGVAVSLFVYFAVAFTLWSLCSKPDGSERVLFNLFRSFGNRIVRVV